MLIVGLTGGIACGKSTVASLLREKGAVVEDADIIAHEVMMPGKSAWRKVVGAFGPEILLPDGTINRRRLGEIVFKDRIQRLRLNSLVHPAVLEEINDRIDRTRRKGVHLLVLDVPLLYEVGWDKMVDLVVTVACNRNLQVARLGAKGFTRKQALARIKSQWPLREKVRRARYVIENNGSLEELKEKVTKLWEELKGEEKAGADCP